MKKQQLLALTLAGTLALAGLAGCKNPAQGGQPNQPGATQPGGQSGAIAPAKQEAGATNGQAAAEAMGDERDAEDLEYMADDAGAAAYGVQALSAEARARLKANVSAEVKTRLMQRRERIKAAIAQRLESKAAIRTKLVDAFKSAPVTTDENGNRTREANFTAEKSMNGKTMTMTITMTRTVNADGVLVYSLIDVSQTQAGAANARSRSYRREKTLQADGSYTVSFNRTRAFADGREWTAAWNKTIALDGGVSGTGTITRKKADGTVKTLNLTLAGNVETPMAEVVDPEAKVETEVTVPVAGEASAEVQDTETNAEVAVDVEADADAAGAEVSADAAATAEAAS